MEIITVLRTCDWEGCLAVAEEYVFRWQRAERAIDLCDKHLQEMNELVGRFIAVGRPIRRARKPRAYKQDVMVNPRVVRAWANEHGVPCSRVGVPPRSVTVGFLRWWCDQQDRAA